jgi:hypothetical protein
MGREFSAGGAGLDGDDRKRPMAPASECAKPTKLSLLTARVKRCILEVSEWAGVSSPLDITATRYHSNTVPLPRVEITNSEQQGGRPKLVATSHVGHVVTSARYTGPVPGPQGKAEVVPDPRSLPLIRV